MWTIILAKCSLYAINNAFLKKQLWVSLLSLLVGLGVIMEILQYSSTTMPVNYLDLSEI